MLASSSLLVVRVVSREAADCCAFQCLQAGHLLESSVSLWAMPYFDLFVCVYIHDYPGRWLERILWGIDLSQRLPLYLGAVAIRTKNDDYC